jgi:RNA polymerase sigma-70 factor (ECF subfamily)
MVNNSDSELVRECLESNISAFEVLIDRYQKTLFNTTLRMVKDYDDAKDIVQTVFIKAYENLDKYNPKFNFFSWIYKMLVNESINFLKQRKRHMALNQNIMTQKSTPEESYCQNEFSRNVSDAVADLPLIYRMVIVFRHFADLSYRDLSYVLGIPEKTVKSRLFTARRMLGEIFTERGILVHE